MLEGLDDIDWANLEHPFDNTADAPRLLRSLLAEDDDVFTDASWKLCQNVCSLRYVCEATSYVVPFLLQIVANCPLHRRAEILEILLVFGDARSFHESNPLAGKPGRGLHTSPDYEINVLKEQAYIQQVHSALGEGWQIYAQFLSDKAASRYDETYSAWLLTYCADHYTQFATLLRDKFRDSGDRLVKSTALIALSALEPHAYEIELLDNFESHCPLLRLVSCIGYCRYVSHTELRQIQDTLIELIIVPDDPDWEHCPWTHHPFGVIQNIIRDSEGEQRIAYARKLLDALRKGFTKEYERITLVLYLSFWDPHIIPGSLEELSPFQLEVLKYVTGLAYTHDGTRWTADQGLDFELKRHGLEELSKLISGYSSTDPDQA